MTISRFAISYSSVVKPLLTLLGMGPGTSGVDVRADVVRVRMGWAFTASIPRDSVTSVAPDHALVTGWGVHGIGGRWLVNGSSRGLVRLTIDPPAPARVLGVPVRLRVLRVSVAEPRRLISALTRGAPTAG